MTQPPDRTSAASTKAKAGCVDRLAWRLHEESMTPRFAFWVALLVFAGLALLTEELSRYRASELASEKKAATLAFASELRARGDRELNSVLYLASGIVGYLVVRHQPIDPDEVNRILAAVHANSRHVRDFSIAVAYRVSYVFPLTGNEAIVGRDYRDLAQQWPAVRLAIDSRQHVLTGPVDLVQGGRGLIYRTPIFVGGSYWGMLATVIDLESLRQSAFAGIDGDRYDFAVRAVDGSGSGGGMLWGDSALFDDSSVLQVSAEVPNGQWIYAVRSRGPAAPWINRIARATGWLLSLLAGIGVGLLLRQRSALARRAGYDSLTDLPNRRLFDDRLEQAFRRRARDDAGQIAVFFIDLDDFKPINDRYGHKAGDAVLRSVARRIREELRVGDTVARWAGDEFVVIVEGADASMVRRLLVRLRQRIASPVMIGTLALKVSASIGSACYPDEAGGAAQLLELADRRMYQDKTGRTAG